MIRRTLSALLAVATAAVGALVAAPAHAAAQCELSAPSRVSINHTRTVLTGTVAGVCRSPDGYASWRMWKDGASPARSTYVQFDQRTDGNRAVIVLDEFDLAWGPQTFHADGASGSCSTATDFEDCQLTQNAPRTDVRLSSVSGVGGRRAKKKILTLAGTSSVYSTSAARYLRHSARGQFQWRARGGAWHGLRFVTTNRSGAVTLRVRAAKGRQYRFVTTTAASWWSSGSRVIAP